MENILIKTLCLHCLIMTPMGSSLFAQSVPGKEYEVTPSETQEKVQLWIPDGVKVIRGVLWIIKRGVTERLYEDKALRDILYELNMEGTDYEKGYVTPVGMRNCLRDLAFAMAFDWKDVGRGTPWKWCLEQFAQMSGHPELAHSCIVPCGISSGGAATTRIMSHDPDRIIAAFPSHQCKNIADIPAVLTIPRLDFIAGEDQFGIRSPTVDNIPYVLHGRAKGAPWGAFINLGGEHQHWEYREVKLMISWLKLVVPVRLPVDITTDKPPLLTPLTVNNSHWLGTISYTKWPIAVQSVTISPASSFTGDKSKALWLPNETFAREWAARMGHPVIR